jgi:hypothetical protein
MHASRRYRDSAAECLLAAQEASQPHCRKLHLSMAISWLSLARQYEAIRTFVSGSRTGCLNQRSPLPKRQFGLFHSRIYIRHEQSVRHLKMPPRFPGIEIASDFLPGCSRSCIIDGEAVACDESGAPLRYRRHGSRERTRRYVVYLE